MLAARYTARSLPATRRHLATESQASLRGEGQVTWQLMPEEHINDLTPEEQINDNYKAQFAQHKRAAGRPESSGHRSGHVGSGSTPSQVK